MKHCLLVYSNPVEGEDKAYNDWYDNQHLTDVLAVPGFVRASRYRVCRHQMKRGAAPASPTAYLAIYEIESDDVPSVFSELTSRSGTSAMVLSDALDMQSISTGVFELISERTAE